MPSPLLAALERLVIEAGELARADFGTATYELKSDGSLVTPSDRKVERFLRPRLEELVPGAAIWGEEDGFALPTDEGLWLIDPIDGTSNFSFGYPYWGVTVGLYRGGRLELGAITLPCLQDTIAAEAGQGVWRNGEQLPAIRPGEIQPWELVGHGTVSVAERYSVPGKLRHMGAFVIESFGFITQGLRGMTSSHCRLYDAAASIVAARELGAVIVHFDGRPFDESDWVSSPDPLEPFAFMPPGSGVFGA